MAAASEKSILIRVTKTSYSNDMKTVDDIGTDGFDFEKLFPRKCSSCRSNPDPGSHLADPDPVFTGSVNAWFIMEPADSGVKMSQILPQDQSDLTARRTASTLVGSSLYEIGVYPNLLSYYRRGICCEMRCLDIQNQSAGWKPWSPLDYELSSIRGAAAFNQYIYMFSRITIHHAPGFHFAYVFNTIKQEGYLIQAPPEFLETPIAEIWAPLEGHGMLVCFPKINGKFYLHNPDRNCWKICENYEPLPPISRGSSLGCLFCARVLVSSTEATTSAELLGVQCFRNDEIKSVLSCVPVDASLGRIAKNPLCNLDEMREEDKPSGGKLRVELSGNYRKERKKARLKCSQKIMKRFSTLPVFPFSKRMLTSHQQRKRRAGGRLCKG